MATRIVIRHPGIPGCRIISTWNYSQTELVIQGSAIGPASFVVGAADLKAVTPGNPLVKYADDTYIVIPAVNDSSRQAELQNIAHGPGQQSQDKSG